MVLLHPKVPGQGSRFSSPPLNLGNGPKRIMGIPTPPHSYKVRVLKKHSFASHVVRASWLMYPCNSSMLECLSNPYELRLLLNCKRISVSNNEERDGKSRKQNQNGSVQTESETDGSGNMKFRPLPPHWPAKRHHFNGLGGIYLSVFTVSESILY